MRTHMFYSYMHICTYICLHMYIRPVAQPTDAVDTVGIRIPAYHTRLASSQTLSSEYVVVDRVKRLIY